MTAVDLARPPIRDRPSADAELAALLAGVADGDVPAFDRFYDRTASLVLGLCLRVTGSPALAEETTQEVYADLWRRTARGYRAQRGSVLSWLLTITHHRAVDCVRSVRAARERELRAGQPELAAPVPTPDERLLAGEERRRLRRALHQLTALQRDAIELTYYRGHSITQAAALAGVPVPTMKTRVRDALRRLTALLGPGDLSAR